MSAASVPPLGDPVEFLDEGLKACAIEASSIGIEEGRMDGTQVRVAIFTNFTQDHLDYHGTMDAYWAAKLRLFRWPGLEAAVVNVDDEKGAELASQLGGLDLWTVSTQRAARLRAQALRYVDGGLAFELHEGDATVPVRSTLIGDYNAHNLLVVLGGLRALGVPLADAAAVVPQLTPVPGRMQRVGTAVPEQPALRHDVLRRFIRRRRGFLRARALLADRRHLRQRHEIVFVVLLGSDREIRRALQIGQRRNGTRALPRQIGAAEHDRAVIGGAVMVIRAVAGCA